MRTLESLALTLAAMLLLTSPARAQVKPFPDAWFFPDRPEGLKGLAGKPAPDLRLKSWIGEKVSLADCKGKVVVIDFWATWCGPCMAAIPENVELVKEHKDDGLVFLGVHDANSGWDSAQKVVDEKKINYPVARDEDGGLSAKNFNLAFWPTYIVVDRAGTVRGAGFIPSHVKDAVKVLLAEPAPPGLDEPEAPGAFPPEVYFAGNRRPAAFKALEGKPLPALAASEWRGEALTPQAMKDRVVVVHFLSSGNALSMRQAEALAALEKEMGPQGVVFAAVCPPDDDWAALTKAAAEGKIPSHLFRDTPAKAEAPARPVGQTADDLGVRFAPATIVADRAGTVRAAGVRPDKVKQVAGELLAEPAPEGR